MQFVLLRNDKGYSAKMIVANDYLIFYYLSEKLRLDISCESSASQSQMIHMNCEALFSLKSNKIFQNIVICNLRFNS